MRAQFISCSSLTAGEALFARGLVAGDGVVGVFAGAHEAVACAVVGDGLVLLAGGLHGFDGGGNGGADARVVAGVEAVDRRGDGGDVGGAGAVEDEGGREVFAMRGEGEGLAATPAEADDGELAVGGGELSCRSRPRRRGRRVTPSGSRPETALTVASWLGNSLEPPPLGPKPLSRSGATTMKPCAASSSAISWPSR